MHEGPLVNSSESLAGALVGGRYRLGSVLGRGGMGVVYRAAQESLARAVAVKVLQPSLVHDADAVVRFRAEAERAGRLAHPHIVQILDFGSEPSGAVWIAMELLEGESLAARIERAPLSEVEVVRVALETLSALEAAHAANLVHRDLKPDNVFLCRVPGIGVSVKVLDFGIAKLLEADGAGKLTATGALVGTPLYMAPEQARGEEVDTRADLYSLGTLLYEALTQRPPLQGKTYPALLLAVMTETPRPVAELRPEVSPALAEIVARAMAKDPHARFQSASEMATALRTLTPSDSIPTRRGVPDVAIGTAPTLATPLPATAYGPPPSSPPPADVPAALAPAAPSPSERAPVAAASAAATVRGAGSWPVALVVAALGGGLLTLLAMRLQSPPAPPIDTSLPTAPVSAPTVRAAPVEPGAGAAMVPMGFEPASAAGAGIPMAASAATTAEPAVALAEMPSDVLGDDAAREPASPHPATPAAGEAEALEAAVEEAVAEPVPERRRPPDRPRYSARVSLTAMRFAGMSSSADLRGPIEAAGGWAACWPDDVAPPTTDRGRDFLVVIAADGHVVSVSPATPLSAEPAAFASCVARRLRGIRFPAPAAGTQVQVRIGFGISGG